MASTGRRSWRQVKTSLTRELKARVAPPLAELIARVTELQDTTAAIAGSLAVLRREMAELTDVITVQVDVGNQTTELLGRLLATTSDRLDLVEDALGQLAKEASALHGSNGTTEVQPSVASAAVSRASEGPSSR